MGQFFLNIKGLFLLSLFLDLSGAQELKAQMWFAEGDEWNYIWAISEFTGPGPRGYINLQLGEDEMQAGVLCNTILSDEITIKKWATNPDTNYEQRKFYLYESNDSVYYFWNEEFRVLYNFALAIGDTFFVQGTTFDHFFCEYAFSYILDSVQHQFVAGKDRRVQFFSNTDENNWDSYVNMVVIEGIGMVASFATTGSVPKYREEGHLIIPWVHICATDPVRHMRFCSFRNGEDFYGETDQVCSFSDPLNIKELHFYQFRAFPNPFSEIIHLSNPAGMHVDEIRLRNALGQLIETERSAETIRPMKALPAGLYIVEIKVGSKLLQLSLVKS